MQALMIRLDNALVDMIFGYTKLYSHREKSDISFEITNEKIRLFSNMLLQKHATQKHFILDV